jgi:hypothetical protein
MELNVFNAVVVERLVFELRGWMNPVPKSGNPFFARASVIRMMLRKHYRTSLLNCFPHGILVFLRMVSAVLIGMRMWEPTMCR